MRVVLSLDTDYRLNLKTGSARVVSEAERDLLKGRFAPAIVASAAGF
jgi:hypothetical protein